jgi:hypothetical protein
VVTIWQRLGIELTSDLATIKRAYALRLKVTRPDDDAAAYQALREAYEMAQGFARRHVPVQGASAAQSEWHEAAPELTAEQQVAPDATREAPGVEVSVTESEPQATLPDAAQPPRLNVSNVHVLNRELSTLPHAETPARARMTVVTGREHSDALNRPSGSSQGDQKLSIGPSFEPVKPLAERPRLTIRAERAPQIEQPPRTQSEQHSAVQIARDFLKQLDAPSGGSVLVEQWPAIRRQLLHLPLSEHTWARAAFAQIMIERAMPPRLARHIANYFDWTRDYRNAASLGPERAAALSARLIDLGIATVSPEMEAEHRRLLDIADSVDSKKHWWLRLFMPMVGSRYGEQFSRLTAQQKQGLGLNKQTLGRLEYWFKYAMAIRVIVTGLLLVIGLLALDVGQPDHAARGQPFGILVLLWPGAAGAFYLQARLFAMWLRVPWIPRRQSFPLATLLFIAAALVATIERVQHLGVNADTSYYTLALLTLLVSAAIATPFPSRPRLDLALSFLTCGLTVNALLPGSDGLDTTCYSAAWIALTLYLDQRTERWRGIMMRGGTWPRAVAIAFFMVALLISAVSFPAIFEAARKRASTLLLFAATTLGLIVLPQDAMVLASQTVVVSLALLFALDAAFDWYAWNGLATRLRPAARLTPPLAIATAIVLAVFLTPASTSANDAIEVIAAPSPTDHRPDLHYQSGQASDIKRAIIAHMGSLAVATTTSAEIEFEYSASGSLVSLRFVKASGDRGFDERLRQAIVASAPFHVTSSLDDHGRPIRRMTVKAHGFTQEQ